MAQNGDQVDRANDWSDVSDKKAEGEKAPGAIGKGNEAAQNSTDDVPGQREKSKLEKAIDPVAGKAEKVLAPTGSNGDPGESGTSQKIKEGLKGAHPDT